MLCVAQDEANKQSKKAAKVSDSAATEAESTAKADATQVDPSAQATASDSTTEATKPADDALQAALTQVADLKQQLDKTSDQYLRAEAEIKNIQARNKKDQAALSKYDGQQLAHDILPVLDNLERAMAISVEGEQGESLKKGIEMVQQHLTEALTRNGVSEIKAEGEKFDPNFHQAVQTVSAENDDQQDHVAQVLQKGYQFKDRVLRPAMVVVAQ